jgi:hypothetical protein
MNRGMIRFGPTIRASRSYRAITVCLLAGFFTSAAIPARGDARTLQLPFSETQIVDLEKDWGSNTKNAELAVETRGWRVVRVEEASPLARAGFHDGDLIPNERIDQSLAAFNSTGHRLAQRIVRILNHLSQ